MIHFSFRFNAIFRKLAPLSWYEYLHWYRYRLGTGNKKYVTMMSDRHRERTEDYSTVPVRTGTDTRTRTVQHVRRTTRQTTMMEDNDEKIEISFKPSKTIQHPRKEHTVRVDQS